MLGTHQWAVSKVSTKAKSVSSAEIKSVGEESAKSQSKQGQKDQHSILMQIKDLHSKLDQAIAEISQILGISKS